MLLRAETKRSSKHTSKKIIIKLNQQTMDAFKKLKISLISDDMMVAYPDFKKEFVLTKALQITSDGVVL